MRRHTPILGTLAAIAGAAPASAQSDAVTIRAAYTFVMDRLRPDPEAGVRVAHRLNLRLSGARRIDEDWHSRTGGLIRRVQGVKTLGASEGGAGAWRVLPGNKIQRSISHPQSVTTLTITVDRNDRCELDVSARLRPGFSEYKFRRPATGGMGFFAVRGVSDLSCEVVK